MAGDDPHLYLVDGSSYIFRAYFALPPMTAPDGTPVNAVYGYTSMLLKLLQDATDGDRPSHFAVIFDSARKTFRNDIYPEYKAHRPEVPEDLVPQFALIREATGAFALPAISLENFEADDIIATYAAEAEARGWKVTVISSDKDLMQLVTPNVTLYDSMKNKRIGRDEVIGKFGVPPEKVVDVQAIAGDSTDNVPGIPGLGVKTAAELITEYGDLDTLLARADAIKQPKRRERVMENAEMARISRALVRLSKEAPVPVPLDGLAVKPLDPEPLLAFSSRMGFKSLKGKLLSHIGGAEQRGAIASSAPDAPVQPAAFQSPTAFDHAAYECVTEFEALERWIAEAYTAGAVAIDTETTSLNVQKAELVGVSLALAPGKACYIPLGHRAPGHTAGGLDFGGGAPRQIPRDAALSRLKPLLEDPSVLKIGQNIKYDMGVLAHYGLSVFPIDDTMLESYVLEGGLHGHGMDELAALHLGHTPIAYKDVTGSGKGKIGFDEVALDAATAYAAEDADVTLRLHTLLKPRLPKAGLLTVYETLERPLVPVIATMEAAGIKVDPAILGRLSNEFAKSEARLEAEIHALAGRPFNVASPKQLGEVLFAEMNLASDAKTAKTGSASTSADVLEKLADEGHAIAAKVLEYRQLAKLRSTYTDALQKEINPRTGRVHTSFALASTTTGRLSSNEPNLQNIPIRTPEGRKIRTAFIAEPGNALIAADYSQIELRLLAHAAKIEALRDAFAAGADIHAMTASEVFNVPMEGMDPMVRRSAKAINFGIIYGISAFGLAKQLGCSRGEAQGYIDAYFARFPGIRRYMEETKAQARANGYVSTLFGRRVHIPALKGGSQAERSFGERAAINAPLQGSAADIIRRAMIRMPDALREAGLPHVRMLLQVHDELVFEAPLEDADAAMPVIRHVMETAAAPAVALDVPLTVEVRSGPNWDEAH